MKEFKVNRYLTLKLENDRTNIYVNGELFIQCKYLLLDFSVKEIIPITEIESIDGVSEYLNKIWNNDDSLNMIPIETAFWGHCSNMQVWYENEYNNCLLPISISFPLLKKLASIGDDLAKKVFKKEIIKRFNSGYIPILEFLNQNRYLNHLDNQEIIRLLDNFEFFDYYDNKIYIMKNKMKGSSRILNHEIYSTIFTQIKSLNIYNLNKIHLEEILKILGEFTNFQDLILINNKKKKKLQEKIGNFTDFTTLYLRGDQLPNLLNLIGNTINLEKLSLNDIRLTELPDTIKELKNLRKLYISRVNLIGFPEIITNLKNLKELILPNNLNSPQ